MSVCLSSRNGIGRSHDVEYSRTQGDDSDDRKNHKIASANFLSASETAPFRLPSRTNAARQ